MAVIQKASLSTIEIGEQLADVIDRTAHDKERFILTRQGTALVALVPLEDIEALEAFEDQQDVATARVALEAWRAEGSLFVSLDEVLAENGLSRADLGQ